MNRASSDPRSPLAFPMESAKRRVTEVSLVRVGPKKRKGRPCGHDGELFSEFGAKPGHRDSVGLRGKAAGLSRHFPFSSKCRSAHASGSAYSGWPMAIIHILPPSVMVFKAGNLRAGEKRPFSTFLAGPGARFQDIGPSLSGFPGAFAGPLQRCG
jgi:hypothetical protein